MASLVGTLLLHGGPSTIPRLVVAIVVNSVQRKPVGLAHVLTEVLKSNPSFPAFTNHNSAPTVVLPSRMLLVGTSLIHARPLGI